MKQSNMITQELKTVEDQTFSKWNQLSYSIQNLLQNYRRPKIITQQLNKIIVYTESKAADCTLQLHLIKRNILPKNVHSIMKLES